jgi:TolB-like protein/Flp pilus assembly protein TadD
MPPVRRLTAILAADVAGYSRLMGADEEGTHERLKAHLRELVDPKVAEYHGRIVKNTGDGFLAEFPSVVDAVRCASEVQRAMADRNANTAEEKQIALRVGINLGDVIAEEHDIFGDGVNVAARLEALAEPGGICVSRVVRDQVRDKLDYGFEDLGEQQVKNIARRVRVYALRPTAGPAITVSTAASIPQIGAAPRPSIVVLPFTNLSDDREQQFFADGITEDLTTDLSRLANMFVISRNTAFTYRNKSIDTKQLARELGVRYLLEGSVRRSGNQVRVTVQLIDADTDAHLWADRFDRDTGDLFVLQNEITSRIAIALNVEVIAAEAARPTNNPDALDYFFRGRAAYWRPNSPEKWAETIALFERALALDPRLVSSRSLLAGALADRVLAGMTTSAAADIARAEVLAAQALEQSPRSSLAHYARGEVRRAQGRYEEAILDYETAIALNRNFVSALFGLGTCKLYAGLIEEVIPLQAQYIRLSPRDPAIGFAYFLIGTVHLLQSRVDEAIRWFERARRTAPAAPVFRSRLAAAYAIRGETERAVAELAKARELSVDGRYSSIARLRAAGHWGGPKTSALFEVTYFAGLCKAGVPEE